MRYINDDKDMILEELLDDIKEDTERCVWSSILSTLLFEVFSEIMLMFVWYDIIWYVYILE